MLFMISWLHDCPIVFPLVFVTRAMEQSCHARVLVIAKDFMCSCKGKSSFNDDLVSTSWKKLTCCFFLALKFHHCIFWRNVLDICLPKGWSKLHNTALWPEENDDDSWVSSMSTLCKACSPHWMNNISLFWTTTAQFLHHACWHWSHVVNHESCRIHQWLVILIMFCCWWFVI